MAIDAEGNLYIAEGNINPRIRMVDRKGVITTVAGTGDPGLSPDGTPATRARLGAPQGHPVGLAFDAEGMLLFAEVYNKRVRLVDPDGLLRTVLGTDEHGLSGEGEINLLTGVAVDSVGNVYVAVHSHEGAGTNRILMVGADGSVTTVAGTGAPGYSGDGAPATQAELNVPLAVDVGPDGNLYIADGGNHVIRMVVL